MKLDENERVLVRGVSNIHHVDDNTKVYIVTYLIFYTVYNVDKHAFLLMLYCWCCLRSKLASQGKLNM